MLSNGNSRFYRWLVHTPHPAEPILQITERTEAGARVVVLSGEADLDTVQPLRVVLQDAAAHADPLVLDLSEVSFADSTMINVLLLAHGELGVRLRLASPSEFVRRLFALTGLEGVLPVYAGVAQAVGADPVGP